MHRFETLAFKSTVNVSFKVIGNDAIRWILYDILLMFNSNSPLLVPFLDITYVTYLPIRNCNTAQLLWKHRAVYLKNAKL